MVVLFLSPSYFQIIFIYKCAIDIEMPSGKNALSLKDLMNISRSPE